MNEHVQDQPAGNPEIEPGLRWAMAVAVVVVLGGGLLLFLPERATRWVWPIGPFNSRFLGAIYLAELAGGLVMVVIGRQLPSRAVIPVALTFTGVVTLASFISLSDFDFDRRGPWAWFVAYTAFTLILPFYLGGLRRGPQPPPTSPGRRRWFLADGALLCAYGLGLLVAPEPLTEFWPWPIDAFHGRIYSAVFLAFGAGSLVLAGRSAPVELRTIGLSRLVFGGLSIAGLALADSVVGTVDYGAPGSVVWVVAMAAIAAVGVVMLGRPPAGRPVSPAG
ncbi:MAG TPA: hypothetical protein VHF27_00715 [Acidimicrobiales bacterium]|nr:hypothetical protein [Acidimicrobiales bacterium]